MQVTERTLHARGAGCLHPEESEPWMLKPCGDTEFPEHSSYCRVRVIAFLTAVLLLSFSTTSPSIAQKGVYLGGDINVYRYMGNLEIEGTGVDYGFLIGLADSNGGAWQVALTKSDPQLNSYYLQPDAKMVILWILRKAVIKIYGVDVHIAVGLGTGKYEKSLENKDITFGTLGFRSDISTPVFSFSHLSTNIGLSFRGTSIPETDRYTNRLGLNLKIIYR